MEQTRSSSGVRVLGSGRFPTATGRWLAANQDRLNTRETIGATGAVAVGGTSAVSDGLEVEVGSEIGARSNAGVVVPSGGTLGGSVTGPLVPGSVVEVSINSQPRLVAAAEVPEDAGTVTFAIPTGAPLDGGEAIKRMHIEDGFEIVATGITIAQVTPTRIPAGEGPASFDRALLLAAGLLRVVAEGRRMVMTD